MTGAERQKRFFVAACVVCGVLFGIPFLIFILKIAAGLFSGGWSAQLSYKQYELQGDLLYAVIFGCLTFLPPLFLYLKEEKPPPPVISPSSHKIDLPASTESPAVIASVSSAESPKAQKDGFTPPGNVAAVESRAELNKRQVLLNTVFCSAGITILGVLYAASLSQRIPNYTVIDGIGDVWQWAVLVAGIAFSVKLKSWKPVLLSVVCWLLCLVPVIGPLGSVGFLWLSFNDLENAKSNRDASPGPPEAQKQGSGAAFQELDLKKCPSCGEMTRAAAGYCRSCNHELSPKTGAGSQEANASGTGEAAIPAAQTPATIGILAAVGVIVGLIVLAFVASLPTNHGGREQSTVGPAVTSQKAIEEQEAKRIAEATAARKREDEARERERERKEEAKKEQNRKNSLLVSAAGKGDLQAVRSILSQGAEINGQDETGNTALISGYQRGQVDVVKFLLERGANPDATDKDGKTVLMIAASVAFLN